MSNTLGLKEAAQLVGVSRDTLRRAIQRGELPGILVTGKTGPQFHVEESAVIEWSEKRLLSFGQIQDDAGPTQAPQDEQVAQAQHAPELDQRLATIEEAQRDQSMALVRLAIQQELFQSVQTWKERAESAKTKVSKLRKQVRNSAELAQANQKQLEQFQVEHQAMLQSLEEHKRRVEWMERRIPGWIRKMFGVG